MIDITFDFRSDSKGDSDTFSPTLNKYHRILWSKELPMGGDEPPIRQGTLCFVMEGILFYK